jgi:tetratricopeptide (TPR) repeat protein
MAEADRFAPWFGIQDLQAQLLADLGSAYAAIGEIPTGAGYLDQALRRVRPRRDFAQEAQILKRLATVAENAGEGPSAASHHQAAAEAGENAGDLETAALEFYALARLKHREGATADARSFASRATDICQQIGWEEGLGMARGLFET